VSVSDLCDQYHLRTTLFYEWKGKFFENGAAAFERSAKKALDLKDRHFAALEPNRQRKNEVFAELMEEHATLKLKTMSGSNFFAASWWISFFEQKATKETKNFILVRWRGAALRTTTCTLGSGRTYFSIRWGGDDGVAAGRSLVLRGEDCSDTARPSAAKHEILNPKSQAVVESLPAAKILNVGKTDRFSWRHFFGVNSQNLARMF
jgi:hypothetical protein